MTRLLLVTVLSAGCGGWARVRYDSPQVLPRKLPGACTVAVTASPDWLAGAGGMMASTPEAEPLLASARATITEDVQKNLCAGGGAGLAVEVEIRRLEAHAAPHWGVFTMIGPVLGVPIVRWIGTAGVTVRLRNGTQVLGEYPGSATAKKLGGAYYGYDWRPESSTEGGIGALALRQAMEDAKTRISADGARIAAALAGGASAVATPLPTGPITIAVTDLKPEGVGASDAALLSELLRGELVTSGSVRVVEKANMEKILSEQAFQQTGCTSAECAVKLGKLLNVRRMVVGTFGRLLGDYVVNIRVVDVETGAAAFADEARGNTSKDLQSAVREMASRMASSVK